MMYNKSEIMKKAWNIFKSTKKTFSEALKESWKRAKESVRYVIPDWFMNKNLDRVTTAHCICYQSFDAGDIVKETEKAYLVELEMQTRSGYETYYTKKIWVPKSIILKHAKLW